MEVRFPAGFRLERLERTHPRSDFDSGELEVDTWLATKALQNQKKHLSVTRVLLDREEKIAGYFTLAMGQADFGDLPMEIAKRLPRRALPVAILAWLGVSKGHQGQGLGTRLVASALRECHEAGQSFPFVAVILDCLNDSAKSFYQQWDFEALPGNPYRLFLPAATLEQMMLE